jgi:hypothetical protein
LRIFRGVVVFLLCAVISLLILDLGLIILNWSVEGTADLLVGSLMFLPFIIAGGVTFGSLLLLANEPKDRANERWLVMRGLVSGLLYSAIVPVSFGAIVPRALVLVAAGGAAGAVSGFLWCRLVERYGNA